MKVPINGGYYSDDEHIYTDERGVFVPSLTQILHLQGLSDYFGIDEDVLENAARRGSEVHALAAAWNQYGDVDPGWISPECDAYFSAYMKFLDESDYKPAPEWTEKPFIAVICGYKVGMTPDTYGKMRKDNVLIEIKCTAAPQPSWALQTAAQEAGIFKSNRCGRIRRHALMLKKDGNYKLLPEYTDHERDMRNMLAAIQNVYWRLEAGQDLRKRLQA